MGQCRHGPNPEDTRMEMVSDDSVISWCHLNCHLTGLNLGCKRALLFETLQIDSMLNTSNSVPCPMWRTREESSNRHYQALWVLFVWMSLMFFMIYSKTSDRCYIYQLPGKIFSLNALASMMLLFLYNARNEETIKILQRRSNIMTIIL